MDGSDLTEFDIVENDGRVPVFSSISLVLIDPTKTFELPKLLGSDIQSLDWKNSDRAEEIGARIQGTLVGLEKKRVETERSIEALQNQKRDSLDRIEEMS